MDRRQTLSITRLYKNHKNKKKNYILIFTVGIFCLTHSFPVLPLKALNELKTFFVSFYDYRKIAKLSSIQKKDLIFMVGWNDYRYYSQPDRHSSMDLKLPATGMFPKFIWDPRSFFWGVTNLALEKIYLNHTQYGSTNWIWGVWGTLINIKFKIRETLHVMLICSWFILFLVGIAV